MSNAVSHDQNFKNMIVEYPRDALALFAADEAPGAEDATKVIPLRQEQLKERLGDRFRALDTPLLVEWSDGRREAVLFVMEEESDDRKFSIHRLAQYCLDLAVMLDTDRVVPVTIFLRGARAAPASLVLGTELRPYLTFHHLACALGEMPAEQWLDSGQPGGAAQPAEHAQSGGAKAGRLRTRGAAACWIWSRTPACGRNISNSSTHTRNSRKMS